jgi:hypothetical protein
MVLSGVVALATLQSATKARRLSWLSPSLIADGAAASQIRQSRVPAPTPSRMSVLDLAATAPLNLASVRTRSSLDDEAHLSCAEPVRPWMRRGGPPTWRAGRSQKVAPATSRRFLASTRKEVGSMAEKEKDRKDHKKDGKDGGKK